jgi:hypothetical protein
MVDCHDNCFDDFCIWMFVLIVNIWQVSGPLYRQPDPPSAFLDSEFLTLVIVGECQQ